MHPVRNAPCSRFEMCPVAACSRKPYVCPHVVAG